MRILLESVRICTPTYFRFASLSVGRGKYGSVFLARHINSSKYVAIKYISKQTVYTHRCVRKLQQEINVLQTIEHPFAVKCLGGFVVNLFIFHVESSQLIFLSLN